ncbi:hypothetical protein [Caloramator sp. Dgby_cultured_2]|nr:hypothetical protein [Caloramator sp. Dgby_cultured_2]WDU83656.1 hypothetical protein PWK10_03420 [Caloramator sp. Dgby_cultured_2]
MGLDSALIKVLHELKLKIKHGEGMDYRIPALWDTFSYSGEEKSKMKTEQ